tara:strand:+ start:186 stop:377 length:192 start_codon:yes stop_codon:yes gene_type:complete
MNAAGLSFSGQSFSFSYLLQYVHSFSFLSFACRFDVFKNTIKKIIINFNKNFVADLLPNTSPG